MHPVELNTFIFFFFSFFSNISDGPFQKHSLKKNLSRNAGMKAVSDGISKKKKNVRWMIVTR